MRSFVAILLLACVAGQLAAVPKPDPVVDPKKDERVNERVKKLFAAMRDGTFRDAQLPKLGWEDVPSLIEMGGSATILKCFPTNPISSLAIPEVAEGVLALWFVEGIRVGKRFPSSNPLLLPSDDEGRDRNTSAANHAKALKSYREWWDKAAALPRDKAAAIEPVKSIGLRWF